MLVSVDELKRYMNGLNMTISQKLNAEDTLKGVQNELERYINRPIELVHVREVVQTDGAGFANLRYSPIHKVIGMTPVDALNVQFPQPTQIVLNTIVPDVLVDGRVEDYAPVTGTVGSPMIVAGGVFVGSGDSWQIVEYVGGYVGPFTDSARQAIKRVAARELSATTSDVLSLRQGTAQTAGPRDSREVGWTEDELAQFDRIRRRVVV